MPREFLPYSFADVEEMFLSEPEFVKEEEEKRLKEEEGMFAAAMQTVIEGVEAGLEGDDVNEKEEDGEAADAVGAEGGVELEEKVEDGKTEQEQEAA